MYVSFVFTLFTLASTAFTGAVAPSSSAADTIIASSSAPNTSVAASSSASAPVVTSAFTPCVLQCITKAAGTSGCPGIADWSCVCTSKAFQVATVACVQANCTGSDPSAILQGTACDLDFGGHGIASTSASLTVSSASSSTVSSASSLIVPSAGSLTVPGASSVANGVASSTVTSPTGSATAATAATSAPSSAVSSVVSGSAPSLPSMASSTPSKSSKSLKAAIVAGITVAGTAVVVVCCLNLLIVRRKRARLRLSTTPQEDAAQPYTVAPTEAEGRTRLKSGISELAQLEDDPGVTVEAPAAGMHVSPDSLSHRGPQPGAVNSDLDIMPLTQSVADILAAMPVTDLDQANGPPPAYYSDSGLRTSTGSDEPLPPYVSEDGGSRL